MCGGVLLAYESCNTNHRTHGGEAINIQIEVAKNIS